MKAFCFLTTILTFTAFVSYGQMDISYPNNRAVFQRNNANEGVIYFGGNFSTKVDRIEARLVSVNGGNPIDWRTVVQSPVSGIYKSSLSTTGGWYRLEVRGIFNGATVATAALEKVGIGEVFVICGQSNAAGYQLPGQSGASDDRVNCVANFSTSSSNLHPFPEFAQLSVTTDIAPAGNGAWNWGILGDLLVARLGVPVLFINTAFEGFDINQWVVSASGGRGVNPFSFLSATSGFPYNSLKNSTHQYTHMLGVRAILFHQGESDTFLSTSQVNYVSRLQSLIRQLRQDSQKDISFVVARVSRFNATSSYQPVIDAQNQVIAEDTNVFSGPNTDGISDRYDNIHFSPSGLRSVADAWNNSLTSDFFNNSKPQKANEPLLPSESCITQNTAEPIILDLPSGLQNSRWSNGVIGSRVSTGAGSLVGRATDAAGNTFFTPQIRYTSSPIPTKPLVTIDGPQTFCPGTAITRLNSSYSFNNIWNTTATTNGINVSTAGNFSVTHTNVYGCQATSNTTAINAFPQPDAIISTSGPTDICSDQELFLESKAQTGNQWSNNANTQRIQVRNAGIFTLTVTNEFGCQATSAPLEVKIRQAAAKPTINIDGSAEFCADQSANLIAVSADASTTFVWNTNDATRILNVTNAGTYSVLATNRFNCSKKSDDVSIIVNTLPVKPIVSADGPTSLCDNRSLRLSANNQADGYVWTNGGTSREITVFQTGNFAVRTVNDKGCTSPVSDPLIVKFYETPSKPQIEKKGLFTLTANVVTELPETNYNWTSGATILNKNGNEIKINQPGNYQAQAFKLYSLNGNQSLRCTSELSDLFFVEIDLSLSYEVYPNPTVNKTLSIETLEDYKNTYITMYDYNGRLVKRFFVPDFNTRQTFDLTTIAAGSYILKLDNPNLTFTRRIIVQ